MDESLLVLYATAAFIGFAHTLMGPDHYLPFIALARSNGWSLTKTLWITGASGVAHVLSSVALGVLGIAFGIGLGSLEFLESQRGEIAAWMLFGFGILYLIFGLRQSFAKKKHAHPHSHADGIVHEHRHDHQDDSHLHPHTKPGNRGMAAWVIFLIFLFGPCEPLIPMLIYPAATQSYIGVFLVSLIFSLSTLVTMLSMVTIGAYGLGKFRWQGIQAHGHTLAGLVIVSSASSILFLGL